MSILPLSSREPGFGVYVHWPFCAAKCPYCDFNSHVRTGVDDARWRDALLADMAHEAALVCGRPLSSIFFGGGTPSLMPPATVAALLDAAGAHWGFAPDVEITLEANPSSVEAARFADLATAGVNRVSLGLQSLNDEALRFLGRRPHTVPLRPQRLHDGGQHQPLHEGARGELHAEPPAFIGVQRVLQQGAEDGWLDLGPILARGDQQQAQFVGRHRQRLRAAVDPRPE